MKLRVLSPIVHNGKSYCPAPEGGKDVIIEINDQSAQQLIDCKAAEEVSGKKQEKVSRAKTDVSEDKDLVSASPETQGSLQETVEGEAQTISGDQEQEG